MNKLDQKVIFLFHWKIRKLDFIFFKKTLARFLLNNTLKKTSTNTLPGPLQYFFAFLKKKRWAGKLTQSKMGHRKHKNTAKEKLFKNLNSTGFFN